MLMRRCSSDPTTRQPWSDRPTLDDGSILESANGGMNRASSVSFSTTVVVDGRALIEAANTSSRSSPEATDRASPSSTEIRHLSSLSTNLTRSTTGFRDTRIMVRPPVLPGRVVPDFDTTMEENQQQIATLDESWVASIPPLGFSIAVPEVSKALATICGATSTRFRESYAKSRA